MIRQIRLIVLALIGTLSASKLMAQSTNDAANQLVSTGTFQSRIIAPFYDQVLNNPASLTAIVFLCIVAFVLDDTPIVNSRYVSHITITMGACTYWLFAGADSVPHYYPHPTAVLVVNGMVAGIVAGIGHRYVIALLVNWMRNKFGMDQVPASRKFLREPNDPNQILSIGQSEPPVKL
jgi:hypothetical protein